MAKKLGEALIERKGLKQKLARIQSKLSTAIQPQVGVVFDTTAYEKNRAALHDMLGRHESLVLAINLTNQQTQIVVGNETLSLMQAIARRDRLDMEKSAYSGLERGHNHFYDDDEKKRVQFDTALVTAEIERCEAEREALDMAIQAVAFSTDLLGCGPTK